MGAKDNRALCPQGAMRPKVTVDDVPRLTCLLNRGNIQVNFASCTLHFVMIEEYIENDGGRERSGKSFCFYNIMYNQNV